MAKKPAAPIVNVDLLCRIEKEVEALEAQELSISANEEIILKRLKEVERTAEDIIKVGWMV